MNLRFTRSHIVTLLVLIFLVASCKIKNDFAGIWTAYDSDLYCETLIQIFDDGKVIMSNLPGNTIVSTDNKVINSITHFDSPSKEGALDRKNKAIVYTNFGQDEKASILFSTGENMDILFPDGTMCVFMKKNHGGL